MDAREALVLATLVVLTTNVGRYGASPSAAVTTGHGQARSEMVSVRKEAPADRGCKKVIRRVRVARNVSLCIERVPTNRRERRSFPERVGVDGDRGEAGVASILVGIDHGHEVITYCFAISEMDRDAFSDSNEGPDTQLRYAINIARAIPASVFANKQLDSARHTRNSFNQLSPWSTASRSPEPRRTSDRAQMTTRGRSLAACALIGDRARGSAAASWLGAHLFPVVCMTMRTRSARLSA